MPDSSRMMESLQRDLADMKRQVSSLADTVASIGNGVPPRDALRAAGRQASHLGEDVRRTAVRHPVASGLVGLAAVGAVLCLAAYAARDHDRSLRR